MDWDDSKPWYHGSPLRLEYLRPGSTITQDRELARVFPHKPSWVVQDVAASGQRRIKHSGQLQGFLYEVAETARSDDVYPHPHTSMEPGQEWLTKRKLKVALIGPTEIIFDELLTPKEIEALRQRIASRSADA